MNCYKCENLIGNREGKILAYRQAFQVRAGYIEKVEKGEFRMVEKFVADKNVFYYCSECLKDGI